MMVPSEGYMETPVRSSRAKEFKQRDAFDYIETQPSGSQPNSNRESTQ